MSKLAQQVSSKNEQVIKKVSSWTNISKLLGITAFSVAVALWSCNNKGNNENDTISEKKDIKTIVMGWDTVTVDAKTYKKISDLYAKDKNYVRNGDEGILWADPETFRVLDYHYTADKDHVRLAWEELLWANSETFTILCKDVADASFAKDDKHVRIGLVEIEWADPKTFKNLGQGFRKDKDHVWMRSKILVWADPKTFQIIEDHKWKDIRSYSIRDANHTRDGSWKEITNIQYKN